MMELSDRMKLYEGIESNRQLIPNLPVIARIDGRSFHSWTRGMDKPFDLTVMRLFDEVTKALVDQTNAVVGYTQSDEITLILWNRGIPDSQILFDGRIAKLTSVLASMATAYFNRWTDPNAKLAQFDCRVWNVPTCEEAVNCLLWREQDAIRNSIQSAAQALYSQKQLHLKNAAEMIEMCRQKGVDWYAYSNREKRGGYFRRVLIQRRFTIAELDALPPQHDARKNPDLLITRHEIQPWALPPLIEIANRVGVIFEGEFIAPDTAQTTAGQTTSDR